MKYLLIILIGISFKAKADIVISTDTTISGTWAIPSTTIIDFKTGGHIHGTGSINGGIIKAAYTQWILDSSVTVNPSGLYSEYFSACWYGASPSKYDNYYQIQTAITNCLNRWPLYIPSGNYNIYTPLYIYQIYNGVYVGCQIHIFGDANMWTPDFGTRINQMTPTQPLFKLQLNKGTEINNITLTGQWRSPSTPDSIYFNTPIDSFTDQSGKGVTSNHIGIVIDYAANQDGSVSGSTAIYIHEMTIRNFTTCIIGSLNGTLNNDILTIHRLQIGDCQRGIVSVQGQEKGNLIDGLYCWAAVHTLFSSGNDKNGQGGNYTITNMNIAGRVIRPFWINNTNWGRISISNGFFETIGTIGILNAGQGLSVDHCTFDFAYPQNVGSKILLTSNSNNVQFNSCDFRYFGQSDTLNMRGRASFVNCFSSGWIKNPNGMNWVTFPLPGNPNQSSVRLSAK